MNTLTYKQAFDKITEAYIKDEIKPFDANFCFCGTLCDNSADWHQKTACHALGIHGYHKGSHGYTGNDFVKMESALLSTIHTQQGGMFQKETAEDALFAGMSAALEVLKQIHIERGEIIDEVPAFTKRELV